MVIPLKIETHSKNKNKNLQFHQGRQVIKYSRREAAQFVLIKIPKVDLTFFSFLNIRDFTKTAMEYMLLKF